MTNQQFGKALFWVQIYTFCRHKGYEQVKFQKIAFFYQWSVRPRWENHNFLQQAHKWNNWIRVWQNLVFYQNFQLLYDVLQKEIENLEFVQGVNFEFVDSLKTNGTKYLLFFDNSCGGICNWRVSLDVATAGKQRRLGTNFIKQNLFHQSKLVRDVEHQNTHIVLFITPHDVMQVSTFNDQLQIGADIVDWYRDATFNYYGCFMIALSARKHDQLRYCTNTGSITSKFYIPERLKLLESSDNEHTKFFYSSSVPIDFVQSQKSFPSVSPKILYQVSLWRHGKSAQRKPAKDKKSCCYKISAQVSLKVSEKKILEKQENQKICSIQKLLQLDKVDTPPAISQLS